MTRIRPIEQCYDNVTFAPPKGFWTCSTDPALTPRANAEAEEASLWMSGCLVAPSELHNVILQDISAIRSQYGDSIPELRTIAFAPIFVSNQLLVKLTTNGYTSFQHGTYHDLDSLNALFRVREIAPDDDWLLITFEGRYHPVRLIEIYERVPTVLLANGNLFGYICRATTIIPWPVE